MANFILLIVIAAIAALLLVIRSNAILVFFALCAGNVLVLFASKNIAYVTGNVNNKLLPSHYTVTKPSLLVALLLAPPILVAALAKHNNGPSKWPIQIFPALATGILGILLITPFLSSSLQADITRNKFWSLLQQNQIPLVCLIVGVSLVLLILSTYPKHSKDKKHRKA